jgi:hypothetical protein
LDNGFSSGFAEGMWLGLDNGFLVDLAKGFQLILKTASGFV